MESLMFRFFPRRVVKLVLMALSVSAYKETQNFVNLQSGLSVVPMSWQSLLVYMSRR